ncbi:MAG: ABC transporter permease subunit [Limnochordia bacterium]|nr:ABC transporter permease [Bacillota bacterium]
MTQVKRLISRNAVPLLFGIVCLLGVYFAKMPGQFLLMEIVKRMARNSFLVLSLIIPVAAGMGLNFGIVLGALAGQIALILSTHWEWSGIGGLVLTALLATPLAVLFGFLAGMLLNKAKGREMITGMVMGFFANGLYQFVFLFLVGTLIPFDNPRLRISTSPGLRNTIDLGRIKGTLDGIWEVRYGFTKFPMVTFLVIAVLALAIWAFFRTKLGQEFRAIGQDRHIAGVAGISVDRNRILAIIISTVLAAWGQLIFLQNIGTLNTYNSHEQVGTFAIAALLIGGATVTKATIGQALMGTFLFHLLFAVSPKAGQTIFGSAQVGEYFRVFVAYGIIAISLALHAWQSRSAAKAKLEEETA